MDRSGDVPRKTGLATPIAGWEAIQSLVVDLGIADPEDSTVNCLLEGLNVTRSLRDENEDAVVAVVSGGTDSMVGADQAIAREIEELIDRYDPETSIVVIDSTEDERLLPIIESRLQVDSVDRVVVRQARDLESTYYLLKQFLADEELRTTVLVPIGIVLLVFPAILMLSSLAIAVGSIAAVIGVFLLYKGLSVDAHLADLSTQAREAMYSGRVSIVTYVVAVGLALVGVFAGVLGISDLGLGNVQLVTVMGFTYYSVPWLALGALAASTGRLLDEVIQNEQVRTSYLNLPFGVLAVGLVVRGFSGYFIERAGYVSGLSVPPIQMGAATIRGFTLTPEEHLAVFVVLGLFVSLAGIRVSSYLAGEFEESGDVA
ncbi:ABC-type multidrug transport system, permease component [Halanaeroarchaeum sp. HSR-CO]|nr:ABC-type multidrug transport system, permease component [Halanaeroarchaeum sp. HSR-CO]